MVPLSHPMHSCRQGDGSFVSLIDKRTVLLSPPVISLRRRCREDFRDSLKTSVLIDRIGVDYVPLRLKSKRERVPEILLVAACAPAVSKKGQRTAPLTYTKTKETSPCLRGMPNSEAVAAATASSAATAATASATGARRRVVDFLGVRVCKRGSGILELSVNVGQQLLVAAPLRL